ncbi:MAG: hypothetical protein IPM81_11345 [Saprospirales bacterium]|nr:hypothetical protein [Saprospirales bacterium]
MPVSIEKYTGTAAAGTAAGIKPWIFPVAFILASLAVYWPTRDAGFVMDWLGWQYAYNRDGWAGVPGSFGYPGLHPVLHFGNYLLYWLFGANSPVWYGVFAVLHGANAWLLTRLALRLPLQIAAIQQLFIAVAAGLLFLFSPYAAEVVVWRVCLHYLLALLFTLLAHHFTLDYLHTPRRSAWWKIQGCAAIALFSFEWSLVAPVLLLLLALVYRVAQKQTGGLRSLLGRLFWPQAGLWALYFGINKLRIGDWVGHYGAETHLRVQPQTMLATMLKYAVKQFGFARHWEHPYKTAVFDSLDAGWPFWLGAGVVMAAAGVWALLFRRINARLQWAGASFAWFLVALLPVSNLYFCFLLFSENDRYGYFATGFGWLGILLLLSCLPKTWFRIAAIGLVALSLQLLLGMNQLWSESEKMYAGLVERFRWYDRDEVIILALPDNYHGVFMFRIIGQDSGFHEALELRRGRPFGGKMWEAVQFNAETPADGIQVETDSSGRRYQLNFRQPGNWWWRNGIGATDYENDRYVFRKKEWHTEVELKEKRPNTALIYPSGGQWIEVQ